MLTINFYKMVLLIVIKKTNKSKWIMLLIWVFLQEWKSTTTKDYLVFRLLESKTKECCGLKIIIILKVIWSRLLVFDLSSQDLFDYVSRSIHSKQEAHKRLKSNANNNKNQRNKQRKYIKNNNMKKLHFSKFKLLIRYVIFINLSHLQRLITSSLLH